MLDVNALLSRVFEQFGGMAVGPTFGIEFFVAVPFWGQQFEPLA